VLGSRTRALSFLDGKKLLHHAFVETGLEQAPEERARPPRKPVRMRRAAPSP